MIDELKRAIAKAEKLSAEEQQAIAQLLFDELSWDASIEKSQDKLSILASEALAEYSAQKTKPLDLGS